jgi:endogenous inhibitor of DNA gyrase (YacG/DUF329 family)
MNCPICRREVASGSPYAPFCSERCRTIDLANWATGEYRISTPLKPGQETDDERTERGE